jgi:hypothetical protein
MNPAQSVAIFVSYNRNPAVCLIPRFLDFITMAKFEEAACIEASLFQPVAEKYTGGLLQRIRM